MQPKKETKFTLDCTHPGEDGIVDAANFKEFLQERIKLFSSFVLSANALRGSWKAASTPLPLLGLLYSYLYRGCWEGAGMLD
uniref:Large ribosomal subunit protein eL22 n=1 Tax=Panthera leo TaxID=9689 RepID=A0A8C8YB20_PANLE